MFSLSVLLRRPNQDRTNYNGRHTQNPRFTDTRHPAGP